jgi:hypothetical protein
MKAGPVDDRHVELPVDAHRRQKPSVSLRVPSTCHSCRNAATLLVA